MKSASTNDRSEYILYDAVGGSRSKPIVKLEYSQDDGTTFTRFGDIENMSMSASNTNTQYNKFILVPPAQSMQASFNNAQSKYSPGGTGEFSDILQRNLLVKPSFGYQMPDAVVYDDSIASTESLITYRADTSGNVIKSTIASAASFTHLPNITDSWTFYDGINYDAGTYQPESYWLSTVQQYQTDYLDIFNPNETTIKITSDSDNIFAYYRDAETSGELIANTGNFTLLGELSNGETIFNLPYDNKDYYQIVFVFNTGIWGSGIISNIITQYTTRYEYFESGQFLVDTANFSSTFGSYKASISCRDYFKKALETKVSLPSYISPTDIGKILRDTADRCGMSHNAGSELISDTGYTVTIADDDNFKNTQALSIFNEIMTYLNFKNVNYRIELNSDGLLQLVIKDSTTVTADWQLDYRWNLLNVSKQYNSDNLLQRITILQKNHSVDTEIQLVTQTYSTIQTAADLTWSNSSIYKRVDVIVNSGDGVFTLNSTSNTGINLTITGSSIDVTVTVYGDELQASPPFIGETIFYNNSQKNDGITHTITNRLIQSDTDAKNMAEALANRFGNPEFVVSAQIPFNPLLELGDRLLLWEKYTNSNTIYRIDSINTTYSADGANAYQSLELTDLGIDMTNFNYDRNNVINGGIQAGIDDIDWDSGFIWDEDLGVDVTEDTTDYSYLKPVKFS